jgi:LDH2 family malate/lactate/ureidoglycolate dehydrogenase
MSDTIHVTAAELHARMTSAFVRSGLSPEAARAAADSLAEAECAGKKSHGLVRVEYVCDETEMKKPVAVSVYTEGPCFLGIDGGRHMAYHPGVIAVGKGARIAKASGLCLAAVRNCGHSGMLGFFARRIAREGLWGLAAAHCMPLLAPHGGGKAVLGTNPVALGVPRRNGAPLVIDFSPAATTFGAVSVARAAGKDIPPGTALDREGRPATDPAAVMDGGTLLPAAGSKGSALALMVQLLCGPLIGAAAVPEKAKDYGLLLLMIDPGLFRDSAETDAGVETVLAAVLGCPPAQGSGRVRLPGDASSAAIEAARRDGLDVSRKLWDRAGEFAGLAEDGGATA